MDTKPTPELASLAAIGFILVLTIIISLFFPQEAPPFGARTGGRGGYRRYLRGEQRHFYRRGRRRRRGHGRENGRHGAHHSLLLPRIAEST